MDRYGAEDIYFVDDNMFIDLDRGRKIMKGIRELGVTWEMQGLDVLTLKRMDDNLLSELKSSGLVRITMGVESGSPRIRKLMNKTGTVEDIKEAFYRLARLDIIVYAGLISGFPTETLEDLKMTVRLALELLSIHKKACTSPIYVYSLYPGTGIYEKALEIGLKPPRTLKEWGKVGGWSAWSLMDGNAQAKRLHEDLYFVSNFLDHKADVYNAPLLVKILSDIYRPIARWRVKNFRFEFLLEKKLAEWFQGKLIGRSY